MRKLIQQLPSEFSDSCAEYNIAVVDPGVWNMNKMTKLSQHPRLFCITLAQLTGCLGFDSRVGHNKNVLCLDFTVPTDHREYNEKLLGYE